MTTSPITITAELLDDLQQKAEAATPGPWEFWHGYVAADVDNDGGHVICARPPRSGGKRQRIVDTNFTHIAAASPATILALVEHIRSLGKPLEKVQGWISVEDRLPDEHKAEYLCLFSGGAQQVTEWLHDETDGWVFWYGDPTHWMPLPAAPAIAQECAEHE